jgi:hypothetical protein
MSKELHLVHTACKELGAALGKLFGAELGKLFGDVLGDVDGA